MFFNIFNKNSKYGIDNAFDIAYNAYIITERRIWNFLANFNKKEVLR